MGCDACEEMSRKGQTVYPYRWKIATVEIVACAVHAKEIIDALNEAQRKQEEHL